MVSAWYSLVIGILICIEGIVLLIFDIDGFQVPDWYLGLVILAGVVGILIGLISIMKRKPSVEEKVKEKEIEPPQAE